MSRLLPASLRNVYSGPAQRDSASHLGMWTFIATEILFFGGLFMAYTVYRADYPQAFANGSRHLEFWIGTTNTVVLLTSSLTLALGDVMIKRGNRRALRLCLALTFLLGALFLGFKSIEYLQKFRAHEVPGAGFQMDGPPQTQLFILLYFAMTGLHAVHMLIGLGLIGWLFRRAGQGRLSADNHSPVEMVGLYWHFVDCIWVFLYPLLYLIR